MTLLLVLVLTQDVREFRDLAYYEGTDADAEKHRLNLFVPDTDDKFPVMMYVHGGAWKSGDRAWYTALGQQFARRGIGCAVISYRLSPKVKHPEHTRDAARAFAWLYRNIEKYGGDRSRLFICGHSAGGHIAALLACDRRWLEEVRVPHEALRGVIAMSGVYSIPNTGGLVRMFKDAFGDDPEVLRDASPTTHLKGCKTPMLVLTETDDNLFVRPFMTAFKRAAEREGVTCIRFVDAEHRDHYTIVTKMIEPGDDPVRDEIIGFIRSR